MRRDCKGLNKKGEPCKSPPMKGGEYCLSHDADKSASVGFVAEAGRLGGRPRRPREIELIQEVAEERKAELRAVYADGLVADRAVVVGNGPTAHVEHVPDYPHRHRVAESMIDRLCGKAVQMVDVSSESRSITLQLDATDPETRVALHEFLRDRPAAA